VWYKLDLSPVPIDGSTFDGRISGELLKLIKPGQQLTPKSLWALINKNWQAIFFANHFLITADIISLRLSDNPADLDEFIWPKAQELADILGSKTIEIGHITAAMLLSTTDMEAMFTDMKLSGSDLRSVLYWFNRCLDLINMEKPYFGKIGRDWAHGFTPLLEQFGTNISLSIEGNGAHYGELTKSVGVKAIKNAFSQGAGAIALIGQQGIGKTSHVYALAQLLLGESKDPHLEHRQIIALNASLIISSAQQQGELERIVYSLLNETVHAGHIILFLDDAQLFFGSGIGTFDISQILLPVIQNRSVQIIMAMSPRDYQVLKSTNEAFAGLLVPIILNEPDEATTISILEDTAIYMEGSHKLLVSYQAITEAYKLSSRYDQDTAYPGRAIKLLEQAVPHAVNTILSPYSVQETIEETHGVKVASAAPVEAQALLNLEDKIHERMINQKRAVSVVSNALRRSRAGVSNPKRPIGSFLFLGPTGVGKTELAKSVAAIYFGSEDDMVRLDMTEYQQESDVSRLLSDGVNDKMSLIMAVRQQPYCVVLLDEIEKAHPNILNLLLQLLDEGQLTDSSGRQASFKDCIIIATSNAGAQEIRENIEQGKELESFESEFVDNLIRSNAFKPELINRFDEVVLFRPLNQTELAQVVVIMLAEVNKTLDAQKISVELTQAAIKKVVEIGYDARLGARPMRRALQRAVEDGIANKILKGEIKPGSHVVMDVQDLSIN
jgi:ATP-dependent Clp protease ATP-binding subunit ClpC